MITIDPSSDGATMELRQLRYFVAVAEHGSMRAAAHFLGVRQPSVSDQIRKLEERVNTNLFERIPRGTRLTHAGRQLLPSARHIVRDVDRALHDAERAGEVKLGALSLGFYTSLCSGPLRETLAACRASSSEVRLELHEGSPPDLLNALRERRIELALTVLEVPAREFETQWLWDKHLVVAVPTDHKVAQRDALTWAEIATLPLVVRTWSTGSLVYHYLSGRIAPNAYLPADQHFVSREALMALVGIGVGVTVLGISGAQASYPGVTFKPLVGENAIVPVTAAWLRDNDNPARGRFVAMLRDCQMSPSAPSAGKPD